MKKLLICMLSVVTMLFATSCKKEYTVTVQSNNTAYGTVTGGGDYKDGETATLRAIPNEGYCFVNWQDNDTQNPRSVKVTGNAVYVANFAVINQNPATDFVGNYQVEATAHVNIITQYNVPLGPVPVTIELQGNDGHVLVTAGEQTTTGYVTSAGLFIEPITIPITLPVSSDPVVFNVTLPMIPKPENGVSQFTAQISATVAGQTVPGTVDVTATKQ